MFTDWNDIPDGEPADAAAPKTYYTRYGTAVSHASFMRLFRNVDYAVIERDRVLSRDQRVFDIETRWSGLRRDDAHLFWTVVREMSVLGDSETVVTKVGSDTEEEAEIAHQRIAEEFGEFADSNSNKAWTRRRQVYLFKIRKRANEIAASTEFERSVLKAAAVQRQLQMQPSPPVIDNIYDTYWGNCPLCHRHGVQQSFSGDDWTACHMCHVKWYVGFGNFQLPAGSREEVLEQLAEWLVVTDRYEHVKPYFFEPEAGVPYEKGVVSWDQI